MRTTTIDLPDEIHEAALALATRRHQSLSETIIALIQSATGRSADPADPVITLIDGFPTLSIGRPITAAEVRELLDDDS